MAPGKQGMPRSSSRPAPRFPVNLIFSARKYEGSFLRCDKRAARKRIQWVLDLLCEESVELNIRFCDAEEMTETNRQFRGKPKPTDVLSFPPSRSSSEGTLGDLLVCVPVCAVQSRQHRVTLSREIERMVIHGIVHLKGLDHERGESAWKVMSALERALAAELRGNLGEADWIELELKDEQP